MEKINLTEETTGYLAQFRPSPDDVTRFGATGGTTGLSKLVPKTHNADICKVYYMATSYDGGFGDVSILIAPFTHDQAMTTIFGHWALFAGRMVICPSTKPIEK